MTEQYKGENWILFQTKYEYMALPVSVATEVMKVMLCMTKEGSAFLVSDDEIAIRMLNADSMVVAIAKKKMVPGAE